MFPCEQGICERSPTLSVMAVLRACSQPGCKALVESGRCAAHRSERNRAQAEARGTASERLYGHRWQQARKQFLSEHPLCSDPWSVHGKHLVAAWVVDHWEPHRGNFDKFWDQRLWRGLCRACNNRKTAIDHGWSSEVLPPIPPARKQTLAGNKGVGEG